jgi:pimeloyl-ACP methyl ester carboxylesterase
MLHAFVFAQAPKAQMTTFLLVHGSCHGAWCWEKIIPRLEAEGHEAVAIDLPSHGQDDTPWWRVTLGAYTRVVRDAARAHGSVVAVGHSMGGGIITQAAHEEPDLFAGLIYVSGFVPLPGETMLGLARRDAIWRGLTVPRYHVGTITVWPERVLDTFYNTSSKADGEAASARLTPQPIFPLVQTIAKPAGVLPPMAFVECTQDRTISLDLQRYMHRRVSMASVATLDCDHSPFYSAPADLVRTMTRSIGAFVADKSPLRHAGVAAR